MATKEHSKTYYNKNRAKVLKKRKIAYRMKKLQAKLLKIKLQVEKIKESKNENTK